MAFPILNRHQIAAILKRPVPEIFNLHIGSWLSRAQFSHIEFLTNVISTESKVDSLSYHMGN